MASVIEPPEEQFCETGDVTLCYETFGDPSDPAMLLVMGLGTQMLGWPTEFCRTLAARGFHVIRYDNRDVGRSTHFDHIPPPPPGEIFRGRITNPPYLLDDMARDGMRLLDCLDIGEAHVVGASMGGMIAQVMAVRHPRRVLSLTSLMSTTGNKRKGRPALGVIPLFFRKPTRNKKKAVKRVVKLMDKVGSTGFDRDRRELEALAELSYDRGADPDGMARQLAASIATGDRTKDLRGIQAPTLVIHGTVDKLVKPSGGKATAAAIRDSKLMMIEGMGHDLPRGVWPRIVDAIVENADRAPVPRAV